MVQIAMVSDDDVGDASQLCRALAARGEEVTAYVRRSSRSVTTAYPTVTAAAGPQAAVPAREFLPFVGDWAGELALQWAKNPPDVVHAHGWLGGLAAQLAARRLALPTVQTFHELAVTEKGKPAGRAAGAVEQARIEPLLARSATWVTIGSNAEADVLARLRRSRAQLSLLPTGVDAEYYSPIGPALPRTDLFRVLCIERDGTSHGGFENSLKALPRLAKAELIMAETACSDRGKKGWAGLRRLATELKVNDRVKWLGKVADDEVPQLLRSADVVACVPAQARMATTALQAMACELPVVASDIGALSDTVIHRVTGLMVAPNRPPELAGALRTLQTETFQREGMGAAGRSRAISRFTWERVAIDALSIYDRARAGQPQRHLDSPVPCHQEA